MTKIKSQTICALCGLLVERAIGKNKYSRFNRRNHLKTQHRIVNEPSLNWMVVSDRIFVDLEEHDIDESARETEQIQQEMQDAQEEQNIHQNSM